MRDYIQLVNGGCALSHKHVEDGCKSNCVEFGGLKPNRTEYMVSLIHVQVKSDLHRKTIHPVMG